MNDRAAASWIDAQDPSSWGEARLVDYYPITQARWTLSNEPVTHWQPAIPVGHTATELKPGETFQWGTDGGTGGFSSPEAMKVMDASLMKDGDQALYYSLGESEESNSWLWGFLTVDSNTGANVFACESGFGDGGYPVYLGLDANDRPAVLLSDFSVLQVEYSGH